VQHLAVADYRRWKQGLVTGALRHAGIDVECRELLDAVGAGRRRATLHARAEGAGFNAARSHKVHPLDGCPILEPGLGHAPAVASTVHGAVGDSDVTFTMTHGGIDCAVKAQKHARAERLLPLAEHFGLARIALNGEVLLTRNAPELQLGRSRVVLPPGSFLQATARGEELLAEQVIEAVGPARHIADLFCGVGPFALRLAERAKIHAFDSDSAAIAAIREAVRKTQGIRPVTAEVRDLFREPLTAAEGNAFDAVVLDPPRAGAEAQMRNLAKSRVRTIASVSCDPATFARDAAILIAGGYRLERVTPLDQFAWSPHVEMVGVFRR
jgi:23S rRNA (uracil1939-C5)-methyltransferase